MEATMFDHCLKFAFLKASHISVFSDLHLSKEPLTAVKTTHIFSGNFFHLTFFKNVVQSKLGLVNWQFSVSSGLATLLLHVWLCVC